MRGVATLSAAAAVWMLLGGRIPSVAVPRMRLPSVPDLRAAVGAGSVATLVVVALTGIALVAAAVGCLLALAILGLRHVKEERGRRALAERWPDFLAILQARLASGGSLSEAFFESAEHVGGPVREVGNRIEQAIRGGLPFVDAVERERHGLKDPVADRVLATLSFANRAGGGRVADLLGYLGQSINDELRLRRAHDAALTQQRLTAGVALAAPWALLVLAVATNPQAAESYATSEGRRIVLIGLVLTGSGYVMARRSARLARSERIFR